MLPAHDLTGPVPWSWSHRIDSRYVADSQEESKQLDERIMIRRWGYDHDRRQSASFEHRAGASLQDRNRADQPAEHLWAFLDEPLVNRYFETIEDLDQMVGERCVDLMQQQEMIRHSTLFHWWPRLEPHAPRRN